MEKAKSRKKQKGMSLIEILPIVIVVTTLFSFLLGAWGIAHKHTLNSIAARTYAFDTFNHRANVMYFSDIRSVTNSYQDTESRYHAVGFSSPDFSAPITPIRYLTDRTPAQTGSTALHTQNIWDGMADRGIEIQSGPLSNVNHVWVTVGYGMCINAGCGEGN